MPSSIKASQIEPTATTASLPHAARLMALALILIAYGLRIYHLEYQSLASDEGISILRSAQPFAQMLQNMPVEHAPGYFGLLHFWMLTTGQSDYAIRYLSLMAGVFAVPLMLRMAMDFGSRRAGLIAAALLATNAFQIWYSQEARMYSWLLVSGALSTWCLWMLITMPRPAVWLGYVASTTASIYIHHFGFLIPVVHIVVAGVWLATRRNTRTFIYWVAAGVTVFLLYLPWMTHSLGVFGFGGWRPPLDPNEVPWMLLQAYTVGETMPEPWSVWMPVVYLLFIILGAVAWYWRRKDAGAFLTIIAAASVLLTWLLVIRQPDFHVRYTIFVSAPLFLLTAGGITSLDPTWWLRTRSGEQTDAPAISIVQVIPWAVVAILVSINAIAVNRLYHDETVQRPDFRAAAHHIQQNLEAGDVVLVDGPNPELVFNHYYSGSAPVFDLRPLQGLPDEEVAAALEEITHDADRVWELLYFKPPGPVQVWLATHGWAAAPSFHNNIRTQLVGLDRVEMDETQHNLFFGDALELISSEYDASVHQPGDLVRISTHWHSHAQAPEYKFSLRLHDEQGAEISAYDYVPQNWFAPTNVWFVDQPATDHYGLALPDDLAPGSYHVTLRLYDPYSGSPVETTAGVDVPIAELMIAQ